MGKRFYLDDDLVIAQKVADMADARGVPMAAVALAWLLSKPAITSPIIGVTKIKHLEDAVAAVDVKLTPEEIQKLEEIYLQHPVLGYS